MKAITQSRPQDRLAAIRENNRDKRITKVATMIAHGCYHVPHTGARLYRYDYEQAERRRVGQWARVAQWVLTGIRPAGTDYCQIGVMEAAYCRVRALMMLGMTLRDAIRDAKTQATPVVLYPYRGSGHATEGQFGYTPESFARRELPYIGKATSIHCACQRWDMYVAVRLMPGGHPERSVYDGCCYIVSLDSSVGVCEYGQPISVIHDRQQSVELAAIGGAKVWDAFLRGGMAAGMRAAYD